MRVRLNLNTNYTMSNVTKKHAKQKGRGFQARLQSNPQTMPNFGIKKPINEKLLKEAKIALINYFKNNNTDKLIIDKDTSIKATVFENKVIKTRHISSFLVKYKNKMLEANHNVDLIKAYYEEDQQIFNQVILKGYKEIQTKTD